MALRLGRDLLGFYTVTPGRVLTGPKLGGAWAHPQHDLDRVYLA